MLLPLLLLLVTDENAGIGQKALKLADDVGREFLLRRSAREGGEGEGEGEEPSTAAQVAGCFRPST
jgi:hypothetical protein